MLPLHVLSLHQDAISCHCVTSQLCTAALCHVDLSCLQAIQADDEESRNVVVVGHSIITAAMLGHCLGIGEESMRIFKADCGGVTVVDFPREILPEAGVVQCINYTAHLGRWSVPITHDDMDSVCGIEGCF